MPEPTGDIPLLPSNIVVEVKSDQSVADDTFEIDQAVVAQMFTSGLIALTSATSMLDAWSLVLPSYQEGEKISLKVNALNSDVPTSPELSAAIVSSLSEDRGISSNNIFIWDRTEQDLTQAGLTLERTGALCRGTVKSSNDPTGIGYEEQHVCLTSKKIHLSSLLTLDTAHLLNVAVLKNHSVAGVTGCLKNHFGSFNNPWDFHEDCSTHIANLNAMPQVTKISRLFVIDALRAVVLGDTNRPFDCLPKRLLLSFDPVAIDQRGLNIRDAMRASLDKPAGGPAEYLQLASDLHLGSTEYDLVEIDLDT